MRRSIRFALSLCVPLTVVACGSATPEPAAPSGGPHWSYSGEGGPEHWGELEPGFALCGKGQKQTPIDLPSRADHAATKTTIAPHWEPMPIKVINNGHAIQVDSSAPTSNLVVDGTTYELKNFHFHSPAEHTIDGKTFEAEMHFVHKSADGKTAVVALLFQRGRENDELRPVWDAMPVHPRSDAVDVGKTLDIASFMPKVPIYLRYEGSLTVPPCTEGVTWLVVKPDPDVPLQMSAAQAARLRLATHGPTNRPIQPLNGRVVLEIAP
jgi:carbonic anhydrase